MTRTLIEIGIGFVLGWFGTKYRVEIKEFIVAKLHWLWAKITRRGD